MNKLNPKKNKHKKEFYNYKYWREIQRNQLGTSANLYFLFSSAIFGFVLSFILEKYQCINTCEKCLLIISLIFLLISLFFYALFTENRLNDFKQTARYINDGKKFDEISKLTESKGERSWALYHKQRCCLITGFVFSLIGFLVYLF